MWACMMPGLPTLLVQKLKVCTVGHEYACLFISPRLLGMLEHPVDKALVNNWWTDAGIFTFGTVFHCSFPPDY